MKTQRYSNMADQQKSFDPSTAQNVPGTGDTYSLNMDAVNLDSDYNQRTHFDSTMAESPSKYVPSQDEFTFVSTSSPTSPSGSAQPGDVESVILFACMLMSCLDS